jgi:hypothetical protein
VKKAAKNRVSRLPVGVLQLFKKDPYYEQEVIGSDASTALRG